MWSMRTAATQRLGNILLARHCHWIFDFFSSSELPRTVAPLFPMEPPRSVLFGLGRLPFPSEHVVVSGMVGPSIYGCGSQTAEKALTRSSWSVYPVDCHSGFWERRCVLEKDIASLLRPEAVSLRVVRCTYPLPYRHQTEGGD